MAHDDTFDYIFVIPLAPLIGPLVMPLVIVFTYDC